MKRGPPLTSKARLTPLDRSREVDGGVGPLPHHSRLSAEDQRIEKVIRVRGGAEDGVTPPGLSRDGGGVQRTAEHIVDSLSTDGGVGHDSGGIARQRIEESRPPPSDDVNDPLVEFLSPRLAPQRMLHQPLRQSPSERLSVVHAPRLPARSSQFL